MITDPNGNILAGPLSKAEGILYAEIDPMVPLNAKWNLDAAGHYARPDAFKLSVQNSSNNIIDFRN